jgi:hypothetical protein
MPSITPINPKIYLNGTEFRDTELEWLTEIRVETEMRLPGKVTLRFQDPQGKLAQSGKFGFGKSIAVKVQGDDRSWVSVIEAQIASVGYETTAGSTRKDRFDGRRGSLDEFFVVAYDHAQNLTRNCTVKGLQQVTASDIVTAIGNAAGLTISATIVGGTYPIVSQVHNDFDLLNAIADYEGVDWWIETPHTLKVGKAVTTGGETLTVGEDCTTFSVKGSALTPHTVSVRGYASDQKQDLVKTATGDGSKLWPKEVSLLNGLSNGPLPVKGTLVSARVQPKTPADSTTLAEGIRDRLVAAATHARGECYGNPKVVIGAPVTIKGAGPADGTYNVTKVEHVVRRGEYTTRFWAGDRTPTSIVDSLSTRAAPSFPFTHFGLVIGIVTNLGSGDQAGMLRVKFPSLDKDLVSAWGRFVAPSAGSGGRGLVMLPEVGDEVLVGFEEGDMQRPVILGGLYVGGDKKGAWPVQGDKITDRRYTSLKGHVLMIQDGDSDAENMFKVTVKGEKGSVILRMGGDKAEVTTPDGVPIEINAGGQSSIKFDGQGNIAIKGNKISIEAMAEVNIKSDAKIAVQAQAELGLEAQAKAELKGAIVNVTAQGPLAAKGAIVQIN